MGFKCSMPRCRDFLLDCEEPKKLVQCRWRGINPTVYLIYRYFLIIYTLMVLLYNITFVTGKNSVKMTKYIFIYLTTWGYTILTLNFLVRGFVSSKYFHWLKIEDDETIGLIQRTSGLPWLLQFAWLLTNIATPIGICISVIFWVVLYPVMEMPANMGNIQLHAVNSLLLLIEFCMVAVPIRMIHIYQPVTFGFAYVAFNAIYWALGGLNPFGEKAIYPITSWDKPVKTAFVILACLGLLIVIQIILVLLSNFLDHISTRANSVRRRSEHIEI